MFSDLNEPDDQEPAPTPEQDEANKKLVVDAYNTLFRDHDVSILDRAFDPNYLQHNSVAPNGTAALKTFFRRELSATAGRDGRLGRRPRLDLLAARGRRT